MFKTGQLFLRSNVHLDKIDLFLLGHNLIHVGLKAGVGLNGLCADGALGR